MWHKLWPKERPRWSFEPQGSRIGSKLGHIRPPRSSQVQPGPPRATQVHPGPPRSSQGHPGSFLSQPTMRAIPMEQCRHLPLCHVSLSDRSAASPLKGIGKKPRSNEIKIEVSVSFGRSDYVTSTFWNNSEHIFSAHIFIATIYLWNRVFTCSVLYVNISISEAREHINFRGKGYRELNPIKSSACQQL